MEKVAKIKICIMKLPPDKVNEIAQELQCGMRCFVQLQTGELLTVPKEEDLDYLDEELWQETQDKLEEDFSNFVEIEPMSSREAFQVMEDFAETTPRSLKVRLLDALDRKKPFQHFKTIVDNAGDFRQQWFAFRDERWEEWVRQQLERIAGES